MKKTSILMTALALALLAAPGLAAAAAVAKVLTFGGTLRTTAGTLETAYQNINFRLYDVPDGGTALFEETLGVQPGTDGTFSVKIGSTKPLDAALFAQQLYLGIQVQGEAEMVPRTQLTPTPYAWSVDWSSLKGFPAPCPAGQFVSGLGPTLTCSAPPQAVAAVVGSGVIGATTSSGTVTVSLLSTGCVIGEVLRFGALGWGCEALPAPVTSVTASAPLTGGGGGTPAIGLMSCPNAGEILKWSGTAWGCATDVDTDTDTGLVTVSRDSTLIGDGTPASPLGVSFPISDPGGTEGSATTAARSDHTHSMTLHLAMTDAFVPGGSAGFIDDSIGGIPARALHLLPQTTASWFPQLGFSPSKTPKQLVVSVTSHFVARAAPAPPVALPPLGFAASVVEGGASTGCSLGAPSWSTVPATVPGSYDAAQTVVLKALYNLTAACALKDDATLIVTLQNGDPVATGMPVRLVNAFVQVFY